MVAARSSSSSSSSSTSSASALLLRVVLLSFCTLLLCPSMTSATDLRRGSAGLEQLEKPRVDGGVPIVDSTFYVEIAKNKGANQQQQQRNGFRSLQEMEGGVTSTVAPTGAPTAAPTASPSAAPTVFSTPEVISAARSWRSSSSSSPVAVGVAMVIAVVAGLAGMA